MQPSKQFDQACLGGGTAAQCDAASLVLIDRAHAAEGISPLVLSADYSHMSLVKQVIATANAERSARGLPAMPESAQLDSMAARGAHLGDDPAGPGAYRWGSNISEGNPTALAADFGWMYNDGPGGSNVDCQPGDMSGCWGHRANILIACSGSAGAGTFHGGPYGTNLAQVFVCDYPAAQG
jgi:hypothetical protein